MTKPPGFEGSLTKPPGFEASLAKPTGFEGSLTKPPGFEGSSTKTPGLRRLIDQTPGLRRLIDQKKPGNGELMFFSFGVCGFCCFGGLWVFAIWRFVVFWGVCGFSRFGGLWYFVGFGDFHWVDALFLSSPICKERYLAKTNYKKYII